jgi:general secretion pathway protein I
METGSTVKNLLRKRLLHSRSNAFPTTGFTLIEVLVAMAILGIGLTVIIELFSGGLRLARTSMEYTKAVTYARMKLEEIGGKNRIEEGIEEGEFEGTFRWQVETKRVDLVPGDHGPDFRPPTELFQVKINVLWKSGLRERMTSLETYKAVKPEENGEQG